MLTVMEPLKTHRPAIMAREHMVASGHYLASAAGMRILEQGGNAIDAGVAAGVCINVLQPDMTNLGGVAAIIIYQAATGEVMTISGLGRWPKKASVRFFKEHAGGAIPNGVLRSVTPAAADAWLTALEHYGTMTWQQVSAPATDLAENGFAAHQFMVDNIAKVEQVMRQWPSNREVFFPNGRPHRVGELVVQRDLAKTFRTLAEAEHAAADRVAGLEAARDLFYRGEIAHRIAEFSEAEGGLMEYEDLAEFRVRLEPPVRTRYRGYEVYACGPWCQGPMVPQTLNILEGYDLSSLGHNSPAYLHLIISALDAAFSDRHACYGDPDFVRVPIRGLLDKEYAGEWRKRIDPDRAWKQMPEPGDPWRYEGRSDGPAAVGRPAVLRSEPEPDTSYVCAVDRWGNGFSATPSGGARLTPVVPGLGFTISSRGYQSWVDESHPSSIQGGKRPRLTPSPGLVTNDGRLELVFGTPGHDVQPQAMVQVLLNVVEFGMDPQEAIEQPRVASYNYPSTGDPHPSFPGLARAEGRIADETIQELRRIGHTIERWPDFIGTAGAPCMIKAERELGILVGGADPRRMSYAIGW